MSATLALSIALSGGSQEFGRYQGNLLNRAMRSGELKKRPRRAKISLRATRSWSVESARRSSIVNSRPSESGKMKSDLGCGETDGGGTGLAVAGSGSVAGAAVAT